MRARSRGRSVGGAASSEGVGGSGYGLHIVQQLVQHRAHVECGAALVLPLEREEELLRRVEDAHPKAVLR